MLPAIRLGAPPAFLAADGADGARLLAVAADGSLRLWDLRAATLELEASVEPLLAGLAPGTTGAHWVFWPGLLVHGLGKCAALLISFSMRNIRGWRLCRFVPCAFLLRG